MPSFGIDDLIGCYRRGVFPMAESRDDDEFFLVDPEWRCVFPLERFHVPHRLARTIRQDKFRFTIDRCFSEVIAGCAAPGDGERKETWISPNLRALYIALARRGHAHSVETWAGDDLVGGLYGVSLGGAFFGESMFSRARDASKAALVHLAARLAAGGYKLLDAQFTTAHLEQFGAETISRRQFHERLQAALAAPGDFFRLPQDAPGAQLLQSIAQIS